MRCAEDGKMRVRYGFRNISAAPNPFTRFYGLEHLLAYSSAGVESDEYVAFQLISGTLKPYSVHATTGARTEITNAGAAVSLHNSDWHGFVFDDRSYFYNINETTSITRHVVGTNNSWLPLAMPTAPAAAPTYSVIYGGGSTPYSNLDFTGIHITNDVAYTGAATSSGTSFTTGEAVISHTANNIPSSFELTLDGASGPGLQNWTYNDAFAFTLRSGNTVFKWDPASMKFTYKNADGSPVSFIPEDVQIVVVSDSPLILAIRLNFDPKTRALWDNVKKIKVEYTVTQTVGSGQNNKMTMSKPFIGGVIMGQPAERLHNAPGLTLAYSYYASTNQFESGLSPQLDVPASVLNGLRPIPELEPLGVHLQLAFIDSLDSAVDNYRLYVFDSATTTDWYRIVTQSDGTDTYDYKLTYTEAISGTKYTPTPFKTDKCVAACKFKEWVVWAYGDGSIRHSRVGDPERQAEDINNENDFSRGATFKLYGDVPLAMFEAGEALIIVGSYGVYAQVGDRPYNMTPPRRLPDASGCAGSFACCRAKDDFGNPGVIYVSRHGEGAFFATVRPDFDGDRGFKVLPITEAIRSGALSIRTFLGSDQSLTEFSTCRVGVDDAQEALWVIMGARALVYRRPSQVDGKRQWEPYTYTLDSGAGTATWHYIAFSTKRRMRAVRSTGEFDELEYNSSTNAYISGTNRDGGRAMPANSIYWESHKRVFKEVRRVFKVAVERETLTNLPKVKMYSTRQMSGNEKTMVTGEHHVRFSPYQQGWEHWFRVTMTEGDDPYRRVVVYFSGPIGARLHT